MGKRPDEDPLADLVTQARQGDKRAYGKLFRSCYKDIYDYIYRRVGNRSDAEDITMQVFTNGLTAIASFEERGCSVKAWLYRIAHNLVVDHFRSSRDFVDIEDMPVTLSEHGELLEGVIMKQELSALYREVMKLPAAQAEVLMLRFMNDLSISETAAALDKKEVTIRALQFKGVKNLRLRMGEPKDEDTGGGSALSPEEH